MGLTVELEGGHLVTSEIAAALLRGGSSGPEVDPAYGGATLDIPVGMLSPIAKREVVFQRRLRDQADKVKYGGRGVAPDLVPQPAGQLDANGTFLAQPAPVDPNSVAA